MNCHYSLTGLTEHRCPECGTAFDPNDAATWLDDAEPEPDTPQKRLLILALAAVGFLSLGIWILFLLWAIL